MSYDELVDGYREMYRRLTLDSCIAQRIRNKMHYMGSPIYHGEYDFWQRFTLVGRLISRGILRGGSGRIWHFLRSLPFLQPRKLPMALVDWVAGLSMQEYVRRHFRSETENLPRVQQLTARILRAGRVHLDDAAHALCVTMAEVPQIAIRADAAGAARFVRRIRRPLIKLLDETHARIILRADTIGGAEAVQLINLLRKLARFGDRVSLVLGERARTALAVDSSVFNLVLSKP